MLDYIYETLLKILKILVILVLIFMLIGFIFGILD